MTPLSIVVALGAAALLLLKYLFLDSLFLSPLRRLPGPKLFALTRWRLAFEDWKGTRTRTINQLHLKYGPAVRIGPNEVSFNSLSALRTIYGPGSRYGRTSFYRMFDVYGEQNLFTFHSPKEHGDRKKLLSHAYSKSVLLKEPTTSMVEEKTRQYIELIDSEPEHISDIFHTLHYFSLDNITEFIYGKYGATSALKGTTHHRGLIADIMHPSRRRLSWFIIHFPAFTKWLYTRSRFIHQLIKPLLPMQQPTTYTGIRAYALQAFQDFRADPKRSQKTDEEDKSILSRLWPYHETQRPDGLRDKQLASECADHFLAGIDTTSDTLMFLIWCLSLSQNKPFQDKLRAEVLSLPTESLNQHGYPRAEASDRCIYLNAVIKETLRLHAPLPSTEPRSLDDDSVVDGYTIPAKTVVGMSPWILHRNPEVFKDPLVFNPDRWLGPDAQELNRWFWGFSSGGRMCIGMHLAMAEMTTLVAALYREYQTSIAPGFENVTPGITARVEVFYDHCFPSMQKLSHRHAWGWAFRWPNDLSRCLSLISSSQLRRGFFAQNYQFLFLQPLKILSAMRLLLHCNIVALGLAGSVSADAWDDFANNMATDLAPIITLFGEQVTKQYLSESTTWLDYFIFAMAPIGVLTALVSAIRVCGSSSLRAFIGRAKEGEGNIEAELLSSTSNDVCELYNNGGIARVFGRPNVLEIVHDPSAPESEFASPSGTAGISLFENYSSTEKGREEWEMKGPWP
ncbi:hypothetical protein FDECE_13065, partial [Fusarium decemcellulare]